MPTTSDPRKRNFIFKAYGQDEQLSKKFEIFPYELARFAYNTERLGEVQSFIDRVNSSGKRPVLIFPMTQTCQFLPFLPGIRSPFDMP